MNFWLALAASVLVSIVSLVGVITLFFKEAFLRRTLIILISFAAGGLIGGAFLHLLPEAAELNESSTIFLFSLIGFILFFILERYFYWRHCHDGVCDVHVFTYLSLLGDGIHNLIDGLIIGTSFVISIKMGIVATLVIIMHEIPQELGDYGVLVYGGFGKIKALFFNFLSALTAVIGTLVGFYFSNKIEYLQMFFLPFAAGGFIYVAACDLIPELHKQDNLRKAGISLVFFMAGITLMVLVKLWFPE